MTHKIVSEMTYNVLSGTLYPTILISFHLCSLHCGLVTMSVLTHEFTQYINRRREELVIADLLVY